MLDDKFTNSLKEWLEKDSHTDNEDIMAGAQMLLKLNRNQALFNTISRRPEKYVSKIIYELKKFLPMRLNKMTIGDVKRLDAELTPEIQAAVDTDMDGSGDDEDCTQGLPAHGGKRPDHDSMPDDIKSIWEENAERWKKIKHLFNNLKTLSQPCDRYELLIQLKEAWYKYKAEFERYDSFELSSDAAAEKPAPVDVVKQITNARAYISKNIDKLQQLREKALSDDASDKDMDRYKNLCYNLRNRLTVLLDNSQVVGDDVLAKLSDGGVKVNVSSDNGEENKGKQNTEAPGD